MIPRGDFLTPLQTFWCFGVQIHHIPLKNIFLLRSSFVELYETDRYVCTARETKTLPHATFELLASKRRSRNISTRHASAKEQGKISGRALRWCCKIAGITGFRHILPLRCLFL